MLLEITVNIKTWSNDTELPSQFFNEKYAENVY